MSDAIKDLIEFTKTIIRVHVGCTCKIKKAIFDSDHCAGCPLLRCATEFWKHKEAVEEQEEENEKHDELEYALGQATAYEEIPPFFRKQAAEAFVNRDDDVAKRYRDLEDTFKAMGKDKRKVYWDKGGQAARPANYKPE